MPSNRKEDFIEDTRFPSAQEAATFLDTWKAEELARVQALGYTAWKPQAKTTNRSHA